MFLTDRCRTCRGIMDDRDPDVLDLRDYLAVLRRQRWAIVAMTAIVVLVALVVTLLQAPTYAASVKIAVEPPSEGSDLERILFGATELGTQQEILTSTALIRGVLTQHDLPTEESDVDEFLDDDVSVEAVDNTTVLQVTVDAEQPRLAASLAQSMAESYLGYLERDAVERTEEATADLDASERTTREELRSVEEQLADGAGSSQESLEEERDQLYARLRWIATRRVELETANAFMRRGDIIQPAVVPDEPASPKPLRTGVLALVLGGMLGVGLAFLRDHLDDVVRDSAAVRGAGADPVLAVIPPSTDASPTVATAPSGEGADGYRRLRAALLAWSRSTGQPGLRVMMVPAGAQGDAGVAGSNLALSLARSGRKVALVDADLARATASDLLGVHGPGLAELLDGRADSADVVVHSESAVHVVGARAGEVQVAEQLASSRFEQLLETLAVDADDVIVVTRSVDAGADALDVAAHGCAAVLVAHPTVTTRSELRSAMEQLHQIGAAVIGTVLADTATPPANRPPSVLTADGDHVAPRPAADTETVRPR